MARILVVDDEVEICSVLKMLLEIRGYQVVTAINGRDAFLKVEKEKVDIILTDVMMPEVDGFELCRQVKADDRYRDIPVVMLTALVSKEDRIRGIEAGAEDFITKPIDQGEVIARIRMLLRLKEANDRLRHAYNTMNSLTDYGENIIKTFNPIDFDFISKISGIVSQIIRKTLDQSQRPQQVLVGYRGDRNYWQWHLYESVFGVLQSTSIKGHIHTSLPLKNQNETKRGFLRSEDLLQPEFLPLVNALRGYSLKIDNMVYFLSDTLCVIALNYDTAVSSYDAAVLNNMVGMSDFLRSLSKQIRETEDAFVYMIHSLARASEVNDEDTGRHILRVGEYAAFIAEKLGLKDKFVQTIRQQAPLHDVGKIHIQEAILKKPTRLIGVEVTTMKMHTAYGARIVGGHARLRMGRSICLTHHERWDGTGYPKALQKEQIPIEGRIVNIADQYDALRNKRIYKEAFDHAQAYRIITQGDERTLPRHFDPKVLKIFSDNGSQFEEIYESLQG
ncbi:MAG TPA: response regulator [Syntrophales bacterium]|nr:response regulator [Syntrophales bacterium]